jgi:hypothetical protein
MNDFEYVVHVVERIEGNLPLHPICSDIIPKLQPVSSATTNGYYQL